MLALRGDLEQAGGSVAVLSRFVTAAAPAIAYGSSARRTATIELRARPSSTRPGSMRRGRTRVHDLPASPDTVAAIREGQLFRVHRQESFRSPRLSVAGGRRPRSPCDAGPRGRARFGPDVEWLDAGTAVDALDYSVDAARAASFYAAIRSYWPGLPDDGSSPSYSGVRPKISGLANRQPTSRYGCRAVAASRASYICSASSRQASRRRSPWPSMFGSSRNPSAPRRFARARIGARRTRRPRSGPSGKTRSRADAPSASRASRARPCSPRAPAACRTGRSRRCAS